ncbi:MAG: acetyl-CoA carboxylase biotin carboxylase subunit [Caldilineaceae bacterium]|nr:acetyl-CoA carboxylase biotin carboxylase subunit [Caldilineaceae bacterium]
MIRSILVASRGEIAVRIIRTCQEMGIRTVAIYTPADADALHVQLADKAVAIESSTGGDAYGDGAAILAVAGESGVDAIHPGAGVLAQDAGFARQVAEAKMAWIGAGAETLERIAAPEALRAALVTVDVVAAGDPSPNENGDFRRVIFQVFGDSQGNTIHLGERECSIHRGQRVLVAETPSPALHSELRARMGRAAVAAAKAAGLVGAGSVTFLLDGESGFVFAGIQSGLAVEHPVTELVAGLDLVRWQIRVADGGQLPLRQEQVQPRGHAIGCHICAEDPANGFASAPGTILRLAEPTGPGIRVDSGLQSGDVLRDGDDSLIAKVSVYAENRAAAVNRMDRALRSFVALGDLTTNTAFLRDVIAHPVFQAGETTTNFVSEHFSDWQPFGAPGPDAELIATALAEFRTQQTARHSPGGEDARSALQRLLDFRL